MEFKCAELTEELLYGHLRKKPENTTRPLPARPQ
jgi:hypothetical protein